MGITLDNLPTSVEHALIARAAAERKSVESVAIDAIARQLGVEPANKPNKNRDLSFLSEGQPLEPEVLEALAEQRQIDPELWK